MVDNSGNLPFSINELELDKFNVRYFIVFQEAGETVFVPSGWYHQVWNITDTISVNHNWFNGCNIVEIWLNLYEHYQKVVDEISDCKDMDEFAEHCQVMLKASYGMNFKDFFKLLEVIIKNRKQCVETKSYEFGPNHCLFDLNAILHLLSIFQEHCSNDVNLIEISTKMIETISQTIREISLISGKEN